MRHAATGCILTFCLAVLSAGPAFTQTESSDASSAATVSAADVAYVYVGTPKGVYLYDAASNGKLTLVSGSPFKTTGLAIGSNGKSFITLGTQYLHSYPVASSGAIQGQVSQINTENYGGGDCPSVGTAEMDHSGQYMYVQNCSNYQTFQIAKASGTLGFQGFADGVSDFNFPLAIPGNDQYAFALSPVSQEIDPDDYSYQVFLRQSNGTLEYWNLLSGFNLQGIPDGYWNDPWVLTAGPANYLAVCLGSAHDMFSFVVNGPVKLASYTVDSGGRMNTTNTWDLAPVPDVNPTVMNMSPSGQLLAVGGDFQRTRPPLFLPSDGLQVFHFNGPDPITPYSAKLTPDPIDQIHWDNNNHLYALSISTGKLYVYMVTPTTIAEAPGSPYTIASPNALVVVSNLCHAPASDGVNICVPASGSSVSSPVLVEATSKVTGTIVSTQLWVDGVKNFNAPGSTTLTTSVSLAAGSHRFAVIATNTSGQKWESTVTATVK